MSGERHQAGQLGPQVEGYWSWLAQRGYSPETVRNMLKDLGQVGRWLSVEGLAVAQLDEDVMVASLPRSGRRAAARSRGPARWCRC